MDPRSVLKVSKTGSCFNLAKPFSGVQRLEITPAVDSEGGGHACGFNTTWFKYSRGGRRARGLKGQHSCTSLGA